MQGAHSQMLPKWPVVPACRGREGRQAGCRASSLFPFGLRSRMIERAQPAETGQGETRGQDQTLYHWVTGMTLKS